VKTRSQSPLQEAKQIWVSPKPQSKRSVIIWPEKQFCGNLIPWTFLDWSDLNFIHMKRSFPREVKILNIGNKFHHHSWIGTVKEQTRGQPKKQS
jgi:hypothetical protein